MCKIVKTGSNHKNKTIAMKKLVFIIFLIIPFLTLQAQDSQQKNKRESKKEKQAKRQEEIKQMLKDRDFVYHPTLANPLSGSTVQLDYSFSARIQGDTINSYMPYYGRAYHVEYASRKGPFDYILPIKNYNFKKTKNGYEVSFEVKNGMDNIKYTFNVSETGYANLTVISTNRQSISYYGTVEKPKKKENS